MSEYRTADPTERVPLGYLGTDGNHRRVFRIPEDGHVPCAFCDSDRCEACGRMTGIADTVQAPAWQGCFFNPARRCDDCCDCSAD